MRLHTLAFLFGCALGAQQVVNPASQRQLAWATVPMPLAQAAALPASCLVDGRSIAVKAERLGVVTQLWHVRVDVPARGTVNLVDWQPLPAGVTVPPFAYSPWITDAPRRVPIRFGVWVNGTWRCNLQDYVPEVVAQSPVGQVLEYRASVGGFHMAFWATIFTGQDAIPIEGSVLWSDPTTTAWSLPDVQFSIEAGEWPTVGEPIALHDAAHNGYVQWEPSRWRLYRGPLPHGVGVTFRGAMLCGDDGPLPITVPQQADAMVGDWRRQLLAAAGEAPLVAAASWAGRSDWMTFGVVPATTQRANRDQVLAAIAVPGNLFDQQTYANLALHGGTGMQPPFGAMKDAIACAGDAWRLHDILARGARDYWMRSCHHRELDGRRTTKAIRPGMETWAGPVEPMLSPDKFGKVGPAPAGWDTFTGGGTDSPAACPYTLTSRVPPDFERIAAALAGTDAPPTRSVYMDDQHRGPNFLTLAYAQTGSRLLRECLLDLLAVDEMRAMPRRRWFDAPRACGRLWQLWAQCMVLLDLPDRDRAAALALAELGDREQDQAEWHYTPVVVMQTIVDDRVIAGTEAQVPWNNALAVLGEMECSAALDRIGRATDAARFRTFARTLGRSITAYSTVRHSTTGLVYPIVGQQWFQGGAAPPASYYTFPRTGAGPSAAPGINLLVEPTVNWWPWYAGALSAAQLPPLDDVAAKAVSIWQSQVPGTVNVADLEWWACR